MLTSSRETASYLWHRGFSPIRRSAFPLGPHMLKIRQLGLTVLYVTTAISPAFAQSMRVPGTSVSLAPPAGFSIAQQYPGFEQPDEQASIMVTELPVAAASMIGSMTAPGLASRGMALISAQDVSIDARPARLLHVSQKTSAGDLRKWILIAGDVKRTAMVVGMFPADSSSSLADSIRHALLTVSFRVGPPTTQFEGLPFQITATSRLKLAERVSNMLMFTESGTTGSPGSTEALFVAGHSIGRGQIPDVQTFSESRAAQTKLITGLTNVTGHAATAGGRDAWELGADARDARSGRPMRLYQVIIPDETGYFILQGLSSADRAAELLPEFRALTASFRLLSK